MDKRLGPQDGRAILQTIRGASYVWNIATDALNWSDNIAEILPQAARTSTGLDFAALLRPDNTSSRYDTIFTSNRQDLGKGVNFQTHYALMGEDRRTIWVEDIGIWFAGPDGRPGLARGIIREVTESYQKHLLSLQESQLDTLTGTYSRNFMFKHLETTLTGSLREQRPVAVLLAAIDNLAVINRAYGYGIGEEVITGTAQHLKATMRDSDLIARYTGNKFGFVLENCDSEQMIIAAHRFLDALNNQLVSTSAGPVQTSLRIGGAVAPRNGRNARAILQNAEEALEFTRANVSQKFKAYSESLVRQESRLLMAQITKDISQAIEHNQIRLALQPVVLAATGKIAFHEALVRIQRPDGQLMLPEKFLPLAEQVGLIQTLDQKILGLAVEHLKRNPGTRLAFNISAATAHDPAWPLRLKAALADSPQLSRQLIVEITETLAIGNLESTQRAIEEMKSIGVSVAMDDFGSGHTSFRGLRHLNFDFIKIDGAFVKNMRQSADDRTFVHALVDLTKYLGVPIVAEWVEDEETARLLTGWGVHYLQGYYFGKATSPETGADDAPHQPPAISSGVPA